MSLLLSARRCEGTYIMIFLGSPPAAALRAAAGGGPLLVGGPGPWPPWPPLEPGLGTYPYYNVGVVSGASHITLYFMLNVCVCS